MGFVAIKVIEQLNFTPWVLVLEGSVAQAGGQGTGQPESSGGRERLPAAPLLPRQPRSSGLARRGTPLVAAVGGCSGAALAALQRRSLWGGLRHTKRSSCFFFRKPFYFP